MQMATQSLLTATSDRRMSQGTSSGATRGSKIQHATVFCTENGLTFQVFGVGRQSRATVDLQAGMFSEYYVAEQRIILDEDDDGDGDDGAPRTEVVKGGEFGINLTTVLGCLCILGPSSLDRTALCLSYNSSEAIFKIELLEEAGLTGGGVIISNCAIPGMAAEDDFEDEELGEQSGLDYAFRSKPIVARVRLKSDFLKGAIAELTDVAGAALVTVGVSKVGLELATFGHSTECHVVIPYAGNHPEIFLSLEGSGDEHELHARNYPVHSILSAMRGLEIANETCISMNSKGMIAIQHQVLDKVGNHDPNYIDFIMGCLHNEEDGDDEDDEDDNGVVDDDNDTVEGSTFGQLWEQSQVTTQGDRRDQLTPCDQGNNGVDFRLSSETDESPKRRISQVATKKITTPVQQEEEDETEDENEESQDSQGPSLFGAVASIGPSRQGRNNHIRRRIDHNHDMNTNNDETMTESEASQVETEFEDVIDVTTNIGRRRASGNAEDAISSPQLMYGDTHLEDDSDVDK